MTNQIFIGPYFSNSLASVVFRRFLAGVKALDKSVPVMTFPAITSPRYVATPQEEVAFIQQSASKEIHDAMSGAINVGVFFMDTLPPDDFFAQFNANGVIPAIVIICGPVQQKALEQAAKHFSQYGLELVTLQDAGKKGSLTSMWTARMPLQPAMSNLNPELDTVLFDGALQMLPEVIEKSQDGKTIYLYDPFDFITLNPPIMNELKPKLKAKSLELKSFTFHSDAELLDFVKDKGLVIDGAEMALLLGAIGEDAGNWMRRAEIILQDTRTMLYAKYPQPLSPPSAQTVPDIPASLKEAEAHGVPQK